MNESTQQFYRNSRYPAFFTKQATLFSPTKETLTGSHAVFVFSYPLYLINTGKTIKKMRLDFGQGIQRNIINNSIFYPQSVSVNYTTSGEKILQATITYTDGSTQNLQSKVYFKYQPEIIVQTTPGAPGCDPADTRVKDDWVFAEESYKGYNANDPRIIPKIEIRKFYADNEFHTDLNLHKPIIILVGFDPGDIRKIQDCDFEQDPDFASKYLTNGVFDPDKYRAMEYLMYYYDYDAKTLILPKMRSLGYDVVMVNHPTFQTTNLDNNQLVSMDGGAYYIESNALALVRLIKKVKAELATVGSSEEIVIVGPSMGGQIARYALAYMEKKYEETGDINWQHNTRLFVSVDSPHLGATVPMGMQSLVYQLKDDGQDQAGVFYDNWLRSPAAQQMMIEQHKANGNTRVDESWQDGRVTGQGYTYNHGNPVFQRYYNDLLNNGLSGAEGWPINIRKIAIANGSMTAKKKAVDPSNEVEGFYGNDSQNTLNIRGFAQVCFIWCWDVHVASIESQTLPRYNNGLGKISRFNKMFDDHSVYARNINNRGNIDAISGGYYHAIGLLHNSILTPPSSGTNYDFYFPFYLGFLYDNGIDLQSRKNDEINPMIPTFSALAIKNPDRNWNSPINKNLVCSDETYFDSFFGYDNNTEHTSFTKESADWFFEELAGDPQDPYYPISNADLKGVDEICVGEPTTIYFGICKLPFSEGEITWQVNTSKLSILSTNNTNHSAIIEGVSDGNAYVTAILPDGRQFTKQIYVGAPTVQNVELYTGHSLPHMSPLDTENSCGEIPIQVNFEPNNSNVQDIHWERITPDIHWSIDYDNNFSGNVFYLFPTCNKTFEFRVKTLNACGWSDWQNVEYDITSCNQNCSTVGNSTSILTGDCFKVYPVPASTNLIVKIKNADDVLILPSNFNVKLYPNTGGLTGVVRNVNSTVNPINIDVNNLQSGNYFVRAEYDNCVETFQIMIV